MVPALLETSALVKILRPSVDTGEKTWISLFYSESNRIGVDHVVRRWCPFYYSPFSDELERDSLSGLDHQRKPRRIDHGGIGLLVDQKLNFGDMRNIGSRSRCIGQKFCG